MQNPDHLSKLQILKTFTLSLIPLVVYFIIDEFLGLYWGVIAAIIAGIIEVIYYQIKDKLWDKIAIASTALIIIMGLLSILLKSPVFIMFKPVIFEGIFGIMLIGISILKFPFIKDMMRKHSGMEISADLEKHLHGMTLRMGIMLLIHAGLIAYVVFQYSKKEWIFVKGVLFYAFAGILFLFEFIYSRFFLRKKLEMQQNETQILIPEYFDFEIENIEEKPFKDE
jgi:intracellular septation protein A